MRRSDDPGLTGGLPRETVVARRSPIGVVGVTFAVIGVIASYMACIHGVDVDGRSIVAFAVWSLVAVLAAFIVDFAYKFLLIFAVLIVGALWWTENPVFEAAAFEAKDLRLTLCNMIPSEESTSLIRQWVC
ncbi:hypothetical protein [Sulfitobacter aestuariivivens]|uniref:Uncharacterized protein n=1 Tax=Sulfitobacter aestuariivivens TaxID=2766981 RepID=A0A927HFT3_9RHOB|nr:hypothetical protein [Sulfitobacter aestuariivivens]MBD3663565.1 hypothetical protein [Sulfitobacter aestuariivivens]